MTAVADSQRAAEMDPVLAAVLANRFESIVREMMNTLFRTGRSSVLNMARDFSCCIVAQGDELLAAAEGLQAHVLGAGLQVASMRALHDDLAPGDAFLHNDPYLGNTHTADHTLLVPVFAGEEHLFTVAAKAHQADCGNSQPSTYMPYSRDVYEEGGLVFPCVRVQRNYESVEDVIRMCRARIRVPEVWYGDYLASLGSVRIGERRVLELIDQYGVETLKAFVTWWLDYSERRMEQAIAELPACRLTAEGTHDPMPGLPDGVPVNVAIDIRPDDGRITIDLRENVDCVDAGINLSESTTRAGAIIGVVNCLPADVPHNAGSFRRLDILMREGSIAGGLTFPHSASMATTNILNRLVNAIQVAFTQIGEGHGLAEGAGAVGVGYAVVSGEDRRSGGDFVNELVLGNNGGPGGPACDGWITYAMPDCAKTIYIDSIEVLERKYPLRFQCLRLLPDSGGAGRFRGAPASELIYGPTSADMQVFYFADFAEHAPAGVLGGAAGAAALAERVESDGSRTPLAPIGDTLLAPGEYIRGLEAGGGGYGDPRTRDVERVLHDVVEGWVTLEAAREVYGVAFTGSPNDETLAVDVGATAALRVREGG
jgi:N-methylhydantoinase B